MSLNNIDNDSTTISGSSKIFHHKRRVEFCETDAAGIIHFSSLLIYMEQTEHAFLRSLGTSVVVPSPNPAEHAFGWPRVRVESDFLGVARFEDVLDIALTIEKLGTKSICYSFFITRDGEPIAKGKTTAVCCQIENGKLKGISIPEDLRQKFSPFVP